MTFNDIEKDLINIEQGKRYINNLAAAIEYYKERLAVPNAVYVKNKVQKSQENNQEQMLIELADIVSEYEELLPQLLKNETKIYKAIGCLDIEEQNILIEKYILGNAWAKVAESFNYSERGIYKKRKVALSKLKSQMDNKSVQ